eukprot:CAMPEP_0119102958 /NCGR_PEP_ID=MMETSP1180-20130426/1540_1 /TAXON_ID=3052 ORGANISM="Chlamydomonas cf sp, Strain CCMP681" /NCGR_SAMPLE_ID=MMETSP1180 /ASSEMBLY_ACC=CAM_ASM_000741 /LENGTH=230 /DNA_ID=CAMNT_0007087351 /DNA_START=98 /DNA_END=790 /DNA_ORIENTATION=-
MTKQVLIICTSASKLGDSKKETGCWMEEVAAPYFKFIDAGFTVTVASIAGGEVPFDPSSLEAPFLTKEAERFMLDDKCMALVLASKALSSVDASTFDAVFLPGGHGTCFDFPQSELLSKTLTTMFDAGKVVSSVCHGPTAFANVKSAKTGEPIVKGKKVTGFSNEEESQVGKSDDVPFLLEDKLKELGGVYEKGPSAWAPHAVRDGNLITGQNPGSSAAVGDLVVAALSA